MYKGKVVVITGGGGVLGSYFVKAFASAGANVAVLGRSMEPLEKVVFQIKQDGGKALAVPADVLNKESMAAARENVMEHFGACNILVNGAGGNHPKGITSKEEFSEDDQINPDQVNFFNITQEGMKHVFDLNFMGTFLPTQIFARDMINKDGVVLNISSVSSFDPLTKVGAYSAAKAAVNNFTKWMAVYFAKSGIRVNGLAPGFFVTNQNRSLLLNEDGSLTSRGKKILDHTPMGRFGNPEDLQETLLWLCGPGSAFVTGIVVTVDGGFTAYSGV